jgi:hypothetical protein
VYGAGKNNFCFLCFDLSSHFQDHPFLSPGDRSITIRELAISTAPMLEVERTHHIVPSPQNFLRLSWALHSGGRERCYYRSHN